MSSEHEPTFQECLHDVLVKYGDRCYWDDEKHGISEQQAINEIMEFVDYYFVD